MLCHVLFLIFIPTLCWWHAPIREAFSAAKLHNFKSISKFTVDEVLEDGSAVAHVEDLSSDISFGGEVLFQNDGTDSYVNDQIITAPKGKVEQIGTCK